MSKLTYKVSYYALYAMFAVIAVVIALFWFGGDATGEEVLASVDPSAWQPAYTSALMYLMYGLLALAIAATLIAAVVQFIAALKDSPKKAFRSLLGIILLAALLIVTWVIGDGTPLKIQGYQGPDNIPFWLKLTDMFLYSIYTLLAITLVSIIVSGVRKRFS